MKEFLNYIWEIIKEPYILIGLISTLIVFSLDNVKIKVGDKNER